ncbi:MAG TPA: hypothetical protein DD381_13840 [Lentisphaeria bacterium]|nr:MAG: hypothetical protein A2X47_13685 [Lentisphaerae bacterium GWF2_38_69]HBM17404.1 hypothetical protein [Lentisphaeria bacterium]
MKLRVFLLFLALLLPSRIFAIEVGQKAPGLFVSQWIKNGPVELYAKKGVKNVLKADYYVVFFFATWANISQDTISFVDGMTGVFRDTDVRFIGISSENAQRVKTFFNRYPNTKIYVGVDDHNKTSNEYLGGEDTIPRFFIFDKNKKLIWKGEPLEVNRVLVNILGGTYEAEKQFEIEKLHADIRTRAQTLDKEGQLKVVEEIYKIDPTDRVALDYKIDELIKDNKIDECISLIRESRRFAASNNYIQFYLYNLELDITMGIMNEKGKKYIEEMSKNYYQTFQNSATALSTMAYRLIQVVPFQITDLREALRMCDRSVELQKEIDQKSSDMGNYLQTNARCEYLVGRMDCAIKLQKEAIDIMDNNNDKEVATLALQYYEQAKAISSDKSN